MTISRRKWHLGKYLALPAGLALWLLASAALAEQVSREQDIVNLRLGQRDTR